jgi:hypothetical protein
LEGGIFWRGEGVKPKGGWNRGVKKHDANTIVQHAKDALDIVVLLGGVWACETHENVVRSYESAKGSIVEFTTILCLEGEMGWTN